MLGLGNILTKGGAVLGFPNKYSFNFDGSNDYLLLPADDNFGANDTWSVSFWFKSNSISTTQALFSASKAPTATNRIGINLHGSVVRFSIYGTFDSTTEYRAKSSTSLSSDTWYHLVATNSNGTLGLYINNVEQTGGGVYGLSHSARRVIGSDINFGLPFNGLIDEVAVWDTALSADDVDKIASKPVDFSKASTYATDRTSNLKLWLRAGDKAEPESTTSIARQDFYTDFDGTDDYVVVGNNPTAPLSISFWFNSSSSATSNQAMYSTTGALEIWIGYNTAGFLRAHFGGSSYIQTPSGIITQNRWYHVTVTLNGTTGKIYIDGVNQTLTTSGTLSAPDVSVANIGRRVDSNGNLFIGKISNLALHQTALDAQTISQMAKSRFTPMRDNRFSVVDFDGSNDFIDISSSLTPSALTFTMWVATVADSSYRTFIQCGDLLISKSNGNQVHVNKFGVGGQNSTTSFVANEWTHIAVTADSSATKVYRNGVLDLDGSAIAFTAGDILIGKFTGGQFTSGSISSVAYYSSVKSAEEVLAIYNDGIGGDESSNSNLIGYWKMDNATTVVDNSSNNNNGTVTGATLISAGTTDSVGNNDGGLY